MIEVEVVGIRLELPANQPVLVLCDTDNTRYLPLWIGTSEATAISLALDGVEPPRPLTHDLLADLIEHLDEPVVSASITELVDGVYYAQLDFASHEPISARPSDAVAVAIRCGAPIYVAQDVMAEAGMDVVDEDEDQDFTEDLVDGLAQAGFATGTAKSNLDPADADLAVEEFRAFLEDLNPEDFTN